MDTNDLKNIDRLITKYNILEIRKKFLNIDISEEIDRVDIKYLVQRGYILATSKKTKNRTRALKIATIVSNLTKDINIVESCKIILSRLRSFPTLNRLNDLYPDSKRDILSFFEQINNQYQLIGNTVEILGESVTLNNIQYNIYNLIKNGKDVSISAPTSAGKSYILGRILLEMLEKSEKNVVYVVPTKALINQVMTELRENVKMQEYFITSSSDTKRIDNSKRGVFVLTQERLYQLCNNRNIDIGTLIIDEAHNIMSDSRGVVLEYSIKYSKKVWKDIRVIFLAPLINNPEKMFEKFNCKDNEVYNSQESPVRQNIIKLMDIPYKGYTALLNNEIIERNIKIKKDRSLSKRVVNVFLQFNNGEKSIIYCNTPKMTQTVCEELYRNVVNIELEKTQSKKLEEFSAFIESYIDKKFMLAKYIKRGISFHYGALPTFIRIGIENLAKEGSINTIVCTSTLLQGVNIPVQNIYICNPKKDNKRELEDLDFWNLVGRAGRTGYDLCGNIILVDSDSWKNMNRYDKKNLEVSYATELSETQLNEVERAIVFKEDVKKNREFIECIESGIVFDKILGTGTNEINSTIIEEYASDIIEKYDEIKDLIVRLLGINAKGIYEIWRVLQENDDNIESFIIPHPYSENFWTKFMKFIIIINDNLMNGSLYYKKDNWHDNENKSLQKLLACSINWMLGKSLKSILFYNFNDFDDENKVTERAMSQITYLDKQVRYELVRGIYAYQEILKEYLIRTERENLIEKIVNIANYIELGACDEVVVELISLGLIRDMALKINKIYKFSNDNIIEELKGIDLELIELSQFERSYLQEFLNKL